MDVCRIPNEDFASTENWRPENLIASLPKPACTESFESFVLSARFDITTSLVKSAEKVVWFPFLQAHVLQGIVWSTSGKDKTTHSELLSTVRPAANREI